ncbi:MAG TPA: protein kinase, partial [Ktedonobacteraceae bacterium]
MTRDLIEQQLGKYQLVSLLGRSGFAEIYLGEHVQFSTRAALKVLHAHLSPTKIKAFEQEAKMIATLVHPHIASILDFGVSNGIPFLVMDYCPHGSLRQRHAKGERIPLLTVISYVKQIADALQYAHNQKHIHHNVKPENMLIGQHNDILLSDFGIATTAQNTFFMSRQAFVGTPPYMAPEQIKLHRLRESDQYALAIVTYEWLTGKLPFLGTPEEIATKHLSVEPPSLRQKLPNLPISVEEVVFKALAKDPKQRFPSVLDFATALEDASQIKQSVSLSSEPNTTSSQPPAVTPVPALTKEVDTPDVIPSPTSTSADDTATHIQEPDPSPTSTIVDDTTTHAQEPDPSPTSTTIDNVQEPDPSPTSTVVDDTTTYTQEPDPSPTHSVVDDTTFAQEPDFSSTSTVVNDTNSHLESQPAVADPNTLVEEPDSATTTIVADINTHQELEPAIASTMAETD